MRNVLSFHKKQGWKPGASVTAWYKFAGDSKDYSGNNRDASGDNITYSSSGNLNYAVFNGSSSYLLANNGLSSSNYTISMRIKTTQTTTAEAIITNGSGNNMQPMFYSSGSSIGQYYWIGSSNGFGVNFNYSDGQWHNIISIRNGTTGYIYVDGVLAGSGTVTSNLYTDQRSIGAQKYYNQYWYSGAMSNLIIDQSPRTADEIADYYNLTKSNYQSSSGGGSTRGAEIQ